MNNEEKRLRMEKVIVALTDQHELSAMLTTEEAKAIFLAAYRTQMEHGVANVVRQHVEHDLEGKLGAELKEMAFGIFQKQVERMEGRLDKLARELLEELMRNEVTGLFRSKLRDKLTNLAVRATTKITATVTFPDE